MRWTHTELFLRKSLRNTIPEAPAGGGGKLTIIHSGVSPQILDQTKSVNPFENAIALVLAPGAAPDIACLMRLILHSGRPRWVHRLGEGWTRFEMSWLAGLMFAWARDAAGAIGDGLIAPARLVFLWARSELRRRQNP